MVIRAIIHKYIFPIRYLCPGGGYSYIKTYTRMCRPKRESNFDNMCPFFRNLEKWAYISKKKKKILKMGLSAKMTLRYEFRGLSATPAVQTKSEYTPPTPDL